MLFTKYNVFKEENLRNVKVIFIVYIMAFLVGTATHILDNINYGFLGYKNVPLAINIYWTFLTFLDPLAVILLLIFPFIGLILSVFIMITDVSINLSFSLYYYLKAGNPINYKVYLQILFLIFLFFTIKYCWRKIKSNLLGGKNFDSI